MTMTVGGEFWAGVYSLLGGVLIGIVVTVTVQTQAERPAHPWKTERCYTNRCIETLLNRLPPDRAHEAKITTWRDSSYVWYRE